MITEPARAPTSSSGARWVESYLFPLLSTHLGKRLDQGLVCLQIEPDDEEEAIRLRKEGHLCHIVISREIRAKGAPWQPQSIVADPAWLPVKSQRYDLIFSGAFAWMAPSAERRRAIGNELARVCRRGGGVLLTLGNRWCPLDLSRRTPLLRSPWTHGAVTLHEIEGLFVGECGFSKVRLLSLAGHFGWTSLSRVKKKLAPNLERYLRWVSTPDRPKRYASPLNPMFALWIER